MKIPKTNLRSKNLLVKNLSGWAVLFIGFILVGNFLGKVPDDRKSFMFITLLVIGLGTLLLIKFWSEKKYITCPYSDCAKSVLIYGRWYCPYCDRKQTTDKLITLRCEFCEKHKETEHCEFCNREFYL